MHKTNPLLSVNAKKEEAKRKAIAKKENSSILAAARAATSYCLSEIKTSKNPFFRNQLRLKVRKRGKTRFKT